MQIDAGVALFISLIHQLITVTRKKTKKHKLMPSGIYSSYDKINNYLYYNGGETKEIIMIILCLKSKMSNKRGRKTYVLLNSGLFSEKTL